MRRFFVLSLLMGLLGMAAPAEAKHFRYLSGHPFHGGFCTIRGPHAHKYGPTDVRLYRVVGGDYYFVGDPVPFGYAGPTFAYYGAHPVVEATVNFGEPVYCYLEGPHYHWYAPPPQSHFEVRSGVHWYVGGFEPIYFEHRPRYVVVNEVYRPIHYQRPRAVVTDAPSGWRGSPPPGSPGPVGWRGSPPPAPAPAAGGWRGSPPAGSPGPVGWRGSPPPAPAPAPAPAAGGWRGAPPASRQAVAVPPAGAQPAPGPAFGTPPPSREHELARGRGHDKNDHDKDDHRGRDDHDRKDDHGGKDDHGHGNHKGRH